MSETTTHSPSARPEPSRWPPPQQTVERLREELEAATSKTSRALLSVELGLALECESAHDQASALYEEAAKLASDASLPWARLAYLAQHGIHSDAWSADGGDAVPHREVVEGRAETLLAKATVLADHDHRMDAAIERLQLAAEADPDNAALWLALELAACQVSDDDLRARATKQRATLASDPSWKALLLKDLAALQIASGQVLDALETLRAAIDLATPVTFLALRALEAAGRQVGDAEVVIRALDAQAQLIVRAVQGDENANSLGVPQHRRTMEEAAACWLSASDATLREGDCTEAARMIDEALRLLPDAPALLQAKLAIADRAGDTESAAAAAHAELKGVTNGNFAAGLWLRIAEFAADRGDSDAALSAVDQALRADPACIPAQTLKLDMLSGKEQAEALASTLEDIAEHFDSEESKAHLYLLAAETWALGCEDSSGAKAALSQCSALGSDPLLLARIARWLASAAGDSAWFEEATRRVLAQSTDRVEQASLAFEHLRGRLLRRDVPATLEALTRLQQGEESCRPLASLVAAWILPLVVASNESSETANNTSLDAHALSLKTLENLALAPGDAKSARALKLAVVMRTLAAGRITAAIRMLSELREIDPADLAVATGVTLLAERNGDFSSAAVALLEASRALDESPLVAHLMIRAALLFWQGGDRERAVSTVREAERHAPASAGPLLRAMLQRFPSTAVEARRAALTVPESIDSSWIQLRRFALEMGADSDPVAAQAALMSAPVSEVEGLNLAVRLAQAASRPAEDKAQQAVQQALDELSAAVPAVAPLAAARAHFLGLTTDTTPEERLARAKRWALLEPGIPSALEWLAAAQSSALGEDVFMAREALAAQLDPLPAAELRAETALLRHLGSRAAEPLVNGTDPSSLMTNLELAVPGSEPSRRADALGGAEQLFGEESGAVMLCMIGYNALSVGDAPRALEAFRNAAKTNPQDVAICEGLRMVALVTDDDALLADAYASLGEAVAEPELRAAMWEQAAVIWLDRLGDTGRGEFALQKSVDLDVRRPVAFNRLFRLLRDAHKETRMLAIIERRLLVSDDLDEVVRLHWEKARACRELGDRQTALLALADVRMLEPDHVGALALAGEIQIKEGRFEEAAEALGQLAQLEGVPAGQRLMSGVAAADLYENKLGRLDSALTVLGVLHLAGLTTLPVRERLARLAAKAQSWEQATSVLQELMHERDTREGRVEAARLALAIHRDELKTPANALPALTQLLHEAPDDAEAIDFMLSGALARTETQELLLDATDALFEVLQRDPMDAERIDRLARLASELECLPLRQAALGALVAIGVGTREIDVELTSLDERVSRLPRMAIDPAIVPELLDPEDGGPIANLFQELAPGLTEVLGPTLKSLDLGKRQRVDPRDGLPLRTAVAAWAGALGIGTFELYVGGPEPGGVRAIPADPPIVVIGADVQAPLSPGHRQAVASELYGVVRGTSLVRRHSPTDLAALVHAACLVGGSPLRGPAYALTPEFEHLLRSRKLPGRYRRRLPELAAAIAALGADVTEWVRAATASLDRVATLAAGDVSCVLAEAGQRGRLGTSIEARRRANRLLSFLLSRSYLELREKLGMGIR